MNDSPENQQPEPSPVPPQGDQPEAAPVPPHDQQQYQQQPPRQDQAYAQGPAPQQSARFFVWIRSLGVRRGSSRWVGGVRRGSSRWVGGVCSGLAERWGIDPVIVRGLAVVLTLFFGIGLLAYGVAWALLPEPDGRIHVEQVARGHWSTGMTGAAVATFLGLAGSGQSVAWNGHGGGIPWPVLWVAAIVALIVWLTNRGKDGSTRTSRGAQYQQQYFGTPGVPGAVPDAAGTYGQGQQYAPAPGTEQYPTAPLTGYKDSWTAHYFGPNGPLGASGPLGPNGPLGASGVLGPNGPLGSHGPLAIKARPRLGAAATLLSLGLAVMVGALVLILNASGVLDLHGYHVAAAVAAAAIIAGLAIIVSGVRGRSAGGVGSFAIVALVLAGLLSMVPLHAPWTPMGNQSWAPTTISAAQDGRDMVIGDATIDLTALDAGSPLAADVQIPIGLVASKVVIKVPTNIPVTIKSDLAWSKLEVQGQPGNNGQAVVQSSTTHVNPQATGHGLVVTLDGAGATITVIPVAGD